MNREKMIQAIVERARVLQGNAFAERLEQRLKQLGDLDIAAIHSEMNQEVLK